MPCRCQERYKAVAGYRLLSVMVHTHYRGHSRSRFLDSVGKSNREYVASDLSCVISWSMPFTGYHFLLFEYVIAHKSCYVKCIFISCRDKGLGCADEGALCLSSSGFDLYASQNPNESPATRTSTRPP